MENEQPSDVPIVKLLQTLSQAEEKRTALMQQMEDEVKAVRIPVRRALAAALDQLLD